MTLNTISATDKPFTSAIGLKPIWSTQNTQGQIPTRGLGAESIVNENFLIIEESLVEKQLQVDKVVRNAQTEIVMTALAKTTTAKSAAGFSDFYYKNQSFLIGKRILSVSVSAANAGVLSLLIGKNVGTSSYSVEVISYNVVKGVNLLLLDRVLLSGQMLGIGAASDTARFYYDLDVTDTVTGGYFYKQGTVFKEYASNYLGYSINILAQDAVPLLTKSVSILDQQMTEFDKLKSKIRTTTGGCLLESSRNFSDFENSGFALTNNIMTSSTAGARLISKRRYAIDRREQTYIFKTTTPASKVVLATTPREGGIKAGSAIRVDFGAGKIQILQRYDGTTLGNVVQEFTPATTLESGKFYKVRIINDGRTIKIQLAKESLANSRFFSDFEDVGQRTETILGYFTYPLYGYEQGNMQGSSTIINESGSVQLYSFAHECISSISPFLYIIGDSITEAFNVTDKLKYGNLLRNCYGDLNVVVSGIGGAVTAGAKIRMADELLTLRPYNVLIYLGSNYESSAIFEANMREMIAQAQAVNANVILATIPTQAALSQVVRDLAIEKGLKVADFESTLKANGTLNVDFYRTMDATGHAVNDGLHPNDFGHNMQYLEVVSVL